MSAREGDGGGLGRWGRGWERTSPGEHRAFTEFRFCVPTADTAELTHKLMRAGEKKIPNSTTKRRGLSLPRPRSPSITPSPTHSLVRSSPEPSDGLCSSSPPAYTATVGTLLDNILLLISVVLNLWQQQCNNFVATLQCFPLFQWEKEWWEKHFQMFHLLSDCFARDSEPSERMPFVLAERLKKHIE